MHSGDRTTRLGSVTERNCSGVSRSGVDGIAFPEAASGAAICAAAAPQVNVSASIEIFRTRADDPGVDLANGLLVLALVIQRTQDRAHGLQPRAALVVGADHGPRRRRSVREAEHLLLGPGVVAPLVDRGQVDRRDLPLPQRVVAAAVK